MDGLKTLKSSSFDIGTNAGIIDKSGSWFSYGDTKLGQETNLNSSINKFLY